MRPESTAAVGVSTSSPAANVPQLCASHFMFFICTSIALQSIYLL